MDKRKNAARSAIADSIGGAMLDVPVYGDVRPKSSAEKPTTPRDEPQAVEGHKEATAPPKVCTGFEKQEELSVTRIMEMKANVQAPASQQDTPPPTMCVLGRDRLGSLTIDDGTVQWADHCQQYSHLLTSTVLAALHGAVDVLACAFVDPVAVYDPTSWAWVGGVQVVIDGSTPPGSPPESIPDSPKPLSLDASKCSGQTCSQDNTELRRDLEDALQREAALLLRIKSFEEESKSISVQSASPMSFGVQHIPTSTVPLTTRGPCATILHEGTAIDLPLSTREGDVLLAVPPRKPLDPHEFVALQIAEYAWKRNICLVAGILYPAIYCSCKSLPQKAGAQKGAALHLVLVSLFTFILSIVFFVRSLNGGVAFGLLGGALLLFFFGFILYRRGREKKCRFLGKEDLTKASDRARRKMNNMRPKQSTLPCDDNSQ